MKIQCHCGATISDGTDSLPQKGHLIADQDWFAVLDVIDDRVIAPVASGAVSKEAAFMLFREIVSKASRVMYQCSGCGRLYVDDAEGRLHCYVPSAPGTSKGILRG